MRASMKKHRRRPRPSDKKPIDDVDVHYGRGTRPQEQLPFSIWVRRKYRWWPGSERYAGLVDRILALMFVGPGVIAVGFFFGWPLALFILVEAFVVFEVLYRMVTGTILGD